MADFSIGDIAFNLFVACLGAVLTGAAAMGVLGLCHLSNTLRDVDLFSWWTGIPAFMVFMALLAFMFMLDFDLRGI